jgi:Hg(II)-responsive transcriptional regulator
MHRMTLTIGDLASRADVNVQTVRYYERRGLVPAPPRTDSGYRQYPPDSVARVQFIKRAQALGFSLREIEELLDLRVHPRHSCAEVRRKAEAKRDEIDRKIRSLRELRTSLDGLIEACDSNTQTKECPIIETLEE